MQIPILSGTYTDEAPDFRTSYPRNMVPVPKDEGISKGYLRPGDGIELFATGPGIDRGGINWNGTCFRVLGADLVQIDAAGTVTVLGAVSGASQVSMDYSFDRLAIAAGGSLYYWNGSTLSQVTDPDIGLVLDMIWVDGYFMTTDGTSVIVTDLNNPYSVNPLRYSSSEVDPDPIVCILKIRDEPYIINRYTVEVFNNVGGPLFPFQRNEGAQLVRGAVGAHAAAVFTQGNTDVLAFLGGGRNEPPAVWLGQNSTTTKISTREIDTILQEYTEAELALCVLETRIDKSHQHLMVHLPDQCLVYDGAASAIIGELVWFTLTSSLVGRGTYRARNLVWCYGEWIVGDPTTANVGKLVNTVSTHYGAKIGWDFGTTIVYNASKGAIFHDLELVCLPGRVALGADPVVWTSYSLDGQLWSQEKTCPAGKQGDRARRLTWQYQGDMQNWRIQRFRGTSDAHMSFARLEATLEPLNV